MLNEIELPAVITPSSLGAADVQQTVLWRSRERQCANFLFFCVCIAFTSVMVAFGIHRVVPIVGHFIAGAPMAIAAWGWLGTYFHWYTLTTQRLEERSGILIKRVETLELYRITDLSASSTLIQTLFGCGRVIITSSDRSHPRLVINAVPKHIDLFNAVRDVAERCRIERRVRFYEI